MGRSWERHAQRAVDRAAGGLDRGGTGGIRRRIDAGGGELPAAGHRPGDGRLACDFRAELIQVLAANCSVPVVANCDAACVTVMLENVGFTVMATDELAE